MFGLDIPVLYLIHLAVIVAPLALKRVLLRRKVHELRRLGGDAAPPVIHQTNQAFVTWLLTFLMWAYLLHMAGRYGGFEGFLLANPLAMGIPLAFMAAILVFYYKSFARIIYVYGDEVRAQYLLPYLRDRFIPLRDVKRIKADSYSSGSSKVTLVLKNGEQVVLHNVHEATLGRIMRLHRDLGPQAEGELTDTLPSVKPGKKPFRPR